MTDICIESGLTGQDVADALRSLSPRLAANTPVLALEGGRAAEAERAVFASGAVMRLFGAVTLADLSEQIAKADAPGLSRLRELAATLPLEGPARLERLRFRFGSSARSVTFLCRRVADAHGRPLFLAAALDIPSALVDSEPPPRGSAEKSGARLQRGPRGVEDVRVMLAPFKDAGALRFLWRTDAEHRIINVGALLAEIVGEAAADLTGRDLAEAAERLEAGQGARLAQSLQQKKSWSGVEIDWPISGATAAVPIILAASPSFDGERRFLGYRGFGLIHLERLRSAAQRIPAERVAATLSGATSLEARPPRFASNANVIPLRPLAPTPKAGEFPHGDDAALTAGALTPDEQKAFRAIATTLGADTGLLADAGLGADAGVGNVPPFVNQASVADLARKLEAEWPWTAMDGAPAARPGEILADAEAILDALPIGVLVCRDEAPIFANRFLLDLLGCVDLLSARAVGALEPIIHRLPRLSREGGSVDARDSVGQTVSLRMRAESLDGLSQKLTLVSLQPRAESNRAGLEAELRHYQNEARELNAILDTATDGVAVLDSQGRIVTLNRSGEALFGYDKAEVAGEPFTMLIAPESRERMEAYLEGLKSHGVASLLNDGREITGLARQGGAIPIFMTLGRVSSGVHFGLGSETDQDLRYCALLRDMTHWKKVERELDDARRQAERANALKSDFLAKISHEIRTPLNAILGFAEVIMDERFGPIGNERYKDYLKDIHSSGALVMSLVNDLLDLSKIEAGKMELEFKSVDANRIVTECVSIMQPQASRARVIMRLSLANRLPHISADERSLRQIVLNLLSNAVKFNQPGGQVIVATALTDGGHAVLRIRDTGVGMSAADIEVALEPFRQVATSRAVGGTGLGLPLTKALVEANRAFFSIKSKKYEGTLVEVAFPPAPILTE
ncbi:MAG: ATP-binding protein [Methylocella sp.]